MSMYNGSNKQYKKQLVKLQSPATAPLAEGIGDAPAVMSPQAQLRYQQQKLDAV